MNFQDFVGYLCGCCINGGEKKPSGFTLFFDNGASFNLKIQKNGRNKRIELSFYNSKGDRDSLYYINI